MRGQHLVIVRYGPAHDPVRQLEWLYNAADIDTAKVVWAREMGTAENAHLIEYYRDRRVWLIEARPAAGSVPALPRSAWRRRKVHRAAPLVVQLSVKTQQSHYARRGT